MIDTSIKHRTSNVIEYEVIMDTDLAIVMTLIPKIKNPNMFNDLTRTVVDSPSKLKNLLLFRTDKNPLSAILNEKYKDSFGSILHELENSYEDEIINNTRPNDILLYVSTMQFNKDLIRNIIICNNNKQKDRVRKFIGEDIEILTTPITDMKDYDCLFVKYTDNFYNYTNLQAKHLYIYNARFNLKEGYKYTDSTLILTKTNRIRTIDPYKNLRVPNCMEENKNGRT